MPDEAISFNGKPQAEAKSCYDACGLPLNDEFNNPLSPCRLQNKNDANNHY